MSGLLAVLVAVSAHAQKLPAPSRTVYKCDKDGKVSYSDVPCLGAQRVDVEPTRGLNKWSGTERIGADVRRERHNEVMADALRPLFNETAKERAKRHHRAKQSPEVRAKCTELDARIASAEAQETQAPRAKNSERQSRLLDLRSQHRNLQC